MASERDLELQDQRNRRRQDDHLNRERENDLHHKTPKQMQELVEKLRKEIAEKDKVIEQLTSQKIPSAPLHHSSLTSDGKAFDDQSCTPRAAE